MTGILLPLPGVTYANPALARRYFASGAWVDMTVGDALAATAARVPDAIAVIADDGTATFAELHDQSDRLAAALLETGLAPGERAIFQMGTTLHTVLALLACYKSGIIPVCAVPQYREVEIDALVDLAGARAYFVQGDIGHFDLVAFAERMIGRHACLDTLIVAHRRSQRGENEGTGPAGGYDLETLIAGMPLHRARARLTGMPGRLGSEDVLSFQLSGGSTGTPKIIPRFHAEYLGHSLHGMSRFAMTGQSRLIWTLPLLHNAGHLYALMPCVQTGMSVVLMQRVDIRRMLELIEMHRVTHAISIGPVAPQILAYPDVAAHDLSSLTMFATMSRADLLEAHLGVPCANLYGITEGLLLCTPPSENVVARHRTQGCSGCADDELLLLGPDGEEPVPPGEPGELCFRGPSSLRGYYGAPEATAAAFTASGHVRSGDLMTATLIDGRTYYTFEGRLRDNINRGGEKISCEEVEAFVARHPAVSDAKLVPMPDPIYGEKGCVFLVTRPDQVPPDLPALVAFLVASGLAKFKCPERIEIVDSFPVTPVGKVDKRAMRHIVAEHLAREREVSAP